MRIKRILDLVMVVLLILLMGFFQTGQTIHEILGILMAICFIIHYLLNKNWYRMIFNGKYS